MSVAKPKHINKTATLNKLAPNPASINNQATIALDDIQSLIFKRLKGTEIEQAIKKLNIVRRKLTELETRLTCATPVKVEAPGWVPNRINVDIPKPYVQYEAAKPTGLPTTYIGTPLNPGSSVCSTAEQK